MPVNGIYDFIISLQINVEGFCIQNCKLSNFKLWHILLYLYKVTANKIQLCFISTQNWTNLANIKLWVYKEYRFCSTKMECQYLVFSKKASTQTLQLIVLHLFTLLFKKKLHSRLRLAEKSIKICNK